MTKKQSSPDLAKPLVRGLHLVVALALVWGCASQSMHDQLQATWNSAGACMVFHADEGRWPESVEELRAHLDKKGVETKGLERARLMARDNGVDISILSPRGNMVSTLVIERTPEGYLVRSP